MGRFEQIDIEIGIEIDWNGEESVSRRFNFNQSSTLIHIPEREGKQPPIEELKLCLEWTMSVGSIKTWVPHGLGGLILVLLVNINFYWIVKILFKLENVNMNERTRSMSILYMTI